MLFPIDDRLDETARYRRLLSALHPRTTHEPDSLYPKRGIMHRLHEAEVNGS